MVEADNGSDDTAKDMQLNVCRTFIVREGDRIAEKLNSEETEKHPAKENKFDFEGKVKPYLGTLPDDTERLKYLYEVKAEYKQTVHFDLDEPDFGEKCEIEIQKIKDRMALEKTDRKQSGAQSEAETTKRDPDFTMRRRVLALLLLTFGRLDLPEDLTKATVAEFFHFITGNSKKNISDLLANPTQTTGSKRSVRNLCDDLHFVRDQLSRLGMSEAVKRAVSEIEFSLEGLEEKSD